MLKLTCKDEKCTVHLGGVDSWSFGLMKACPLYRYLYFAMHPSPVTCPCFSGTATCPFSTPFSTGAGWVLFYFVLVGCRVSSTWCMHGHLCDKISSPFSCSLKFSTFHLVKTLLLLVMRQVWILTYFQLAKHFGRQCGAIHPGTLISGFTN
jgi:hypothetical protein